MRSQVVKRININLTQNDIDKIEGIKKAYAQLTGKRLSTSDAIRDAINHFSEITIAFESAETSCETERDKYNYLKGWLGIPK